MDDYLKKKIDRGIKLIVSAEKKASQIGQPLEIAYSGGKDSDVILELAKMSGVNYKAIYKNTTIDPPATISHALEMGAEMVMPKKTFFQLIEQKGFPSRFVRFCCQYLKEYKTYDYCVLGIRREESTKRMERYKEPEMCRVYNKNEKVRQYFPILDWTLQDVEIFIKDRGIKCSPVYYDEEGNFHVERRLGCMCCPLATRNKRIEEFKKYPNMVKQYCKHGDVWFKKQKAKQTKTGKIFNDVFEKFYFTLFCDTIEEFKLKTGKTLFDNGINCKEFLENYFKLKL